MPDKRHRESADLEDYEVLDASDTLDGAPGDDPLDRGVVTPDRWSAGVRFGTTAAEQQTGESLDQLLAEEEPDVGFDVDDEVAEDTGLDENTTDEDVGRYLLAQGPEPRTGRLVAEDEAVYDVDEAYVVTHDEHVAHDAGIDVAERLRKRRPSTSSTRTPTSVHPRRSRRASLPERYRGRWAALGGARPGS